MPEGGDEEVDKRHGEHEFPGETEELVGADPGQGAARPNEQGDHGEQLETEPNRARNDVKETEGRKPASEKQCNSETAHGEQAQVFAEEEERVFETGILGEVTGD